MIFALFQDHRIHPFGELVHLSHARLSARSLVEHLEVVFKPSIILLLPYSHSDFDRAIVEASATRYQFLVSEKDEGRGFIRPKVYAQSLDVSSADGTPEEGEEDEGEIIFLNARHSHDHTVLKETMRKIGALAYEELLTEDNAIVGYKAKIKIAHAAKNLMGVVKNFVKVKEKRKNEKRENQKTSKKIQRSAEKRQALLRTQTLPQQSQALENNLRQWIRAYLKRHEHLFQEHSSDVWMHPTAEIHPTCVFSNADLVVIDQGVVIEPHCYLRGPIYLAKGTKVRSHSRISASATGHGVKIGGEITHSSLGNYSNKVHDGFLGHSLVGDFVNIGSGVEFSNLKNTYGEIALDTPWGKFPTGTNFFGSYVGDFCKITIGTRIFSGKTLGSASFVGGQRGNETVSRPVPSFYFNDWESTRIEPLLATVKRVYDRRDVPFTDIEHRLFASALEQKKIFTA